MNPDRYARLRLAARFACVALTLASVPALAQDDLDIEIDLGGPSSTATGTGLTYTGGTSQRSSGKVAADMSISISAAQGTVSVRCTDTEFVEARVDYTIEGTTEGPMEAYGNSLKLSTAAEGGSGAVKLIAGSRPSAVTGAKIALSVNVPKDAKVTVSASHDWVQVMNCNGTVTASAGKNGAYVDGELDAFTVSAGSGDVKVVVQNDAKITGNSSVSATKGAATVVLGMAQDLKLDAQGANISIPSHNVIGSVAATAAAGTVGAGGPTLKVRASGDVTIKTP